jgi:ferredoxin-NADP reductase
MHEATTDRRESAATIWTTPWLRPFNDLAAIDDLLAQVHPTWSLGRIKARVVAVLLETPDTKSFVLRPNRNWPGFRAGQHVGVEVEIAGVRHQRRYSLSSAPERRRVVAITVKRHAGGRVSNWLHDHLQIGDTLVLNAPAGDFVLPDSLPTRLLMLSAGSGITPLMSMLRLLARDHAPIDVAFVHVARRPADAIFGAELAALRATWRTLALHPHHSETDGRFDLGVLARLVPDYAERSTLLCGPHSFMTDVREQWRTLGIESRLQCESFGGPVTINADDDGTTLEVRCTRSERVFTVGGTAPLLVEAEQAGLRPRYGCRMGICHTCVCVKRSGTVENLRTGEISADPDEHIQLCISRARSDLTLEL